MDNFFLSNLGLDELYQAVFEKPEIVDMYFAPESEETEIKNTNSEGFNSDSFIESFENESELANSIRIGIMKEIAEKLELKGPNIAYLANSYYNKYFYNLVTYQDKEIFEFNKLAA